MSIHNSLFDQGLQTREHSVGRRGARAHLGPGAGGGRAGGRQRARPRGHRGLHGARGQSVCQYK